MLKKMCVGKNNVAYDEFFWFGDFNVKVRIRSRHLNVSGILYYKLKLICEIQMITESRLVL